MSSTMVTPSKQFPAPAQPTYRKVQRAALAVCMVLAPLSIALAFTFDPQLGVPRGNIHTQIVATQAVSPAQFRVYPIFYFVPSLVYPLSYLGLGLLAMKRAPWLATLGIASGLLGSLPWPLFAGTVALGQSIVQVGWNPAFETLGEQFQSNWVVVVLFLSWVIGHLLGYVLLGLALVRARVIPLWAAWLFVVGVPLQMVAYPAKQGLWQILGFVLVLLGSVPAALALLQFKDVEAPVRAVEKSALTS
jgi:hypothetical protein